MTSGALRVEVVVSTYNHPRALDLVLRALLCQSVRDFSICVADDGSGDDTARLLADWTARLGPRLRHLWQPDRGFRKNRILNQAIASARADYLIFLDGDCLPSAGFVARHLELARPRRFCTGGVIRLSREASEAVTPQSVEAGDVFQPEWLARHHAVFGTGARLKAGLYAPWIARTAERLTTVGRTWNGGNSSTARINLLRVNGFDENFGYGADDIELGFRLNNAGIQGRHLRYSAPVLHMDHERTYVEPGARARNKASARQVLKEGRTVAAQGIGEH
jgi:glycosyltransferase involved in cell wall biosynthesis